MGCRTWFITGTDTGVGKTLLTALLVRHLRSEGKNALAIKPFCSGGTRDVELLYAIQEGHLRKEEINPFYFAEPVAPLISTRRHRRRITLRAAAARVKEIEARCEHLLVEGSGGLLVPLGEDYRVMDLIARLRCEVIVVARNRLGTINHTLLTVECLQRTINQRISVVMMEPETRERRAGRGRKRGVGDVSRRTNAALLEEILAGVEVWRLPYLGLNPLTFSEVKNNARNLKKTLAQILA
jgi:dethiobiotin synthetase